MEPAVALSGTSTARRMLDGSISFCSAGIVDFKLRERRLEIIGLLIQGVEVGGCCIGQRMRIIGSLRRKLRDDVFGT